MPVELEGKNPPAVFLLSPPRSGSTLLRVMLAGHPRLFAPPELELLGFNTMDERREAFTGRDSFWLEGVIRAVMEIRSCDPEEAKEWIASCERDGWSTQRFYRQLQEQLGERLLVDKTPSYALEMSVLERAEAAFDKPFYLHLIRHPYGMIHSFEEAKLEQVFFRRPHSYERRELAELVWLASQQNILEFLSRIPAERRIAVHFEELVREPERVLRGICETLGLEYHPDMAQPYQEKRQRMTDGVYAASRMLGDVKFHQHRGVSSAAADRWKEAYREDFLGELTWTVAASLGYEDRPTAAGLQAIVPVPREGTRLPLSFAQERLWFLDQLEPGSATYNIPFGLRIDGRFQVGLLAAGLTEIARRHESLRTSFPSASGEPVQAIAPAAPVPLPLIDLSALPDSPRWREAEELVTGDSRTPFDLARGPVIRARLVRLAEDQHVLLLNVHHIASDGWSVGILLRELGALYSAFLEGREVSSRRPLPELPVQYADFAAWQRDWLQGEVLEKQLGYWRERLAGMPALQLPTDRPRSGFQTQLAGRVSADLDEDLVTALQDLNRRERSTLFMTVLVAYDVLLARYSGQHDFAVGTPTAGRNRAETEGLIGFFVNNLVLRADLPETATFREALARTRKVTLEAFSHQDLPFQKLVQEVQPQRALGQTPLFQASFVLQNVPEFRFEVPGLTWRGLANRRERAEYDLTLLLREIKGRLKGFLEFDASLFDVTTGQRMLRHFEVLLRAFVADPARRLSEIPLLTGEERHQLLVEGSDTRVERADACLHELFEQQAHKTPDAAAVIWEGKVLTYAELDRRAERLAAHLRGLGAGPERLVGLCLERSAETYVGLLGILKSGAAYLPLDLDLPRERMALYLEDSGTSLVVTRRRWAPLLPEGVRTVLFDDEAEFTALPDAPVERAAPWNLAYVIYTSGSTGRPKGVVVEHRSAAAYALAAADDYETRADDRLLHFAAIAFDASIEEIFPIWARGGAVLPRTDAMLASAREFLDTCAAWDITVLNLATSYWHEVVLGLSRGEATLPPRLRLVVMGNERALPERVAAWPLLAPGIRLVNSYGPTETTVATTHSNLTSVTLLPGREVPIGVPVANARTHVVDRDFQLVPVGVPGELCIGGIGLTRGYLDRPDLTAEKFIPDPFTPRLDGGSGARLYRTGDLVRLRPDGQIEFLGRIDHQVKVRGFRIELGEIESALCLHPAVRDAAVVAREDKPGNARLVGYVVLQEGSADTGLREFLRARLPEAMVPSVLMTLDALPRTAGDKVDRRALPEPPAERAERSEFVAPRTPTEELVAEMWAQVLGVERIGALDNFFDLGGQSLLATQVISRLRQEIDLEVPLRTMFEASTLERFSLALEDLLLQAAGDEPVQEA